MRNKYEGDLIGKTPRLHTKQQNAPEFLANRLEVRPLLLHTTREHYYPHCDDSKSSHYLLSTYFLAYQVNVTPRIIINKVKASHKL